MDWDNGHGSPSAWRWHFQDLGSARAINSPKPAASQRARTPTPRWACSGRTQRLPLAEAGEGPEVAGRRPDPHIVRNVDRLALVVATSDTLCRRSRRP